MDEVSGKWLPENPVAVIALCERLKAAGGQPTFKLDYYGRSPTEVTFILTVAEGEPKRVFLSGSMKASAQGGA